MDSSVCCIHAGRCLLAWIATAAFSLLVGTSCIAGLTPKKHVVFGWEFQNATPSNILQIVDSLDNTPIDGIGLHPRLIDRHGRLVKYKIMNGPAIEWADLEPWVPVLRELSSHRSMRESFMKSIGAPIDRLDWTDDATWRRLSESMRQLAKFARKGGLKGLWVDDEDYCHQRQYYWRPGDPPYDRLCEIVRKRGQEVFYAAFSEYPDMTVFFFRFLTRVQAYFNCDDPASARRARGDVWPSFLNGILDVIPPTAKLVDGYEYSYRFEAQKNGYQIGHALQKSRFANLADAQNRAKYLTQVSSSLAIYMDKYVNPETSRWYAAPLNGSRSARFAADVGQATRIADEYVWFWSEKYCWANWSGKMPQSKKISLETWEEKLPGILDAMAFCKDSPGFAAKRLAVLKSTGKYVPLNTNGECRALAKDGNGKLPAPYSSWADPKYGEAGKFMFDSTVGECDTSSLAAEGVAGGCFVMSSGPVTPGKMYLVGFSAKGDIVGGGVEWKRDGKWDFSIPGISVPVSAPDGNGWRHGLTAICVPEGANGFGLQLSIRQRPDERSWFDNIFYCEAE